MVYIAAPYAARALVKAYADELATIGIECASTWVTETTEINDQSTGAAAGLTDEQVYQHVTTDLYDVGRADVLVHLTAKFVYAATSSDYSSYQAPALNSGGRHVELGYALALNKFIINVGDPENVFHRGRATNVLNWHQAVLTLVQIEKRIEPQQASAGDES